MFASMSSSVRKVRIAGREIEARFEVEGTKWLIDIGEGKREASVIEVEPGVYSVLLEGRSFNVRMGEIDAVVEDPRELRKVGPAAGLEGPQTIAAPMPGKVVRVLAQEGDDVERGQGLIVIEAMKMQNELKSPKAGRVISLPAQEGAAVGAGQVLAVVD